MNEPSANPRRRALLRAGGGLLAGSVLPGCAGMAPARSAPHVVVIGGGFAGATCAKYLRRWSLALDLRIIARTVALVLFDRQAY